MALNLSGCALNSGAVTETKKEPSLTWNVSYIRGLVIVQGALKSEQISFEKALMSKDAAKLKGSYADGRIVQILISKLNSAESRVVVQVDNSQAEKEDARKILALIAQYSKVNQ